MASLIINTVRNVVPNWRDYKTTAELGELNGNNATVQKLPFFSIDEYIRAWMENPSIPYAGDLISAAIMANQQNNPIVQKAAKYITERKDDVTDSLYRTSLSIVPARETISEPDSISVSERLENILNQNTIIKERISESALKSRTNFNC